MENKQKQARIQKIKNLFLSDKDFKKVIDQVADNQSYGENNEK